MALIGLLGAGGFLIGLSLSSLTGLVVLVLSCLLESFSIFVIKSKGVYFKGPTENTLKLTRKSFKMQKRGYLISPKDHVTELKELVQSIHCHIQKKKQSSESKERVSDYKIFHPAGRVGGGVSKDYTRMYQKPRKNYISMLRT